MRAGWGIAIFIAMAVALMVIGGIPALLATGKMQEVMAAHMYAQAHPNLPHLKVEIPFVPQLVTISDGISFFGLLGVCWFFHKAERRPLRAYGIGGYRVRDIMPGAFWGLFMLSAVVGVLKASHLIVFEGINVHGAAAIGWGLAWLIAFALVGLCEEYTFRGYIQYTLMRGVMGLAESISPTNARTVAFWIAGLATSILFTLAHMRNGGENVFGLVQVFLAGATFVYALWRTGSLWWAIGFHMTWDWAQSFLFGTADSGNLSVGRLFLTHPQGNTLLSGGSAGPEGSIFASVALLLTLLVIHFQKPGMQPSLEQEPREPMPPITPGFHSNVA